MSPKNCMVAQSGGPTVAINASLAGVIDGVMRSDMYDTVYGSLNGITGILNNDLTNLSELMQQNSEYLDRLKVTPAMYLGSCRYKLPNYLDDDSSYVFIFKQFETYHIDAFFYIGGNDSMDTVLKLSEYGKKIGSPVRIVGIPKTIDNDLCETDHTPGFGSAAKYIASSLLEIAHDTFIYAVKSVTIVEIMGRDAGWLTAAAALATNGTGLGGGDIKFCGILGLVYGPSGMALVFLTAAVTAMPVIFLLRRLYRTGQPLAIPFLPFLACGCCTATLAQLFLR